MSASDPQDIDLARRRLLIAGAGVVGGGIAVAAALPLIDSMNPSAAVEAAGAPLEVDVSGLAPGELLTVQWRQRPVWVLHRTGEQLASLASLDPLLKDAASQQPQQLPSCRNRYRSIRPEYFVTVAICTHLGCIPQFRPDVAPADLGPTWKGGFFCACHGSRYDLAGRVYDGSPAPLNLPPPPYYYVTDTRLRIGESRGGGDRDWAPEAW